MNEFLYNYAVCALWSSNDNSDEYGGDPLDRNYDIQDLSPEAQDKMKADCRAFQNKAGDLLNGITEEQAGHDFWLTRNGHGAGFWDRGLGLIGEKLTAIAHSFGECDLYVGDDGKIYIEKGE